MPLLPDPIHMVMARQLSYLISQSRNIVRPWWLRQSYHNTPDLLHTQLQSLIDQIEQENETLVPTERFDQIVLAYGLCSNSVIGLCSRSLPVVLPRCDDCIALLLGSAERYQHFFQKLPGNFGIPPAGLSREILPAGPAMSGTVPSMWSCTARKTPSISWNIKITGCTITKIADISPAPWAICLSTLNLPSRSPATLDGPIRKFREIWPICPV